MKSIHIPFVYGKPVPPSRFIGRSDSLRTVFSRLSNGEGSAIVGETHIGKTSFLRYLRDERVRTTWLHNHTPYAFVDLDCHALPSSYQPVEFWGEVLSSIEVAFEEPIIQRQIGVVRRSGYGSFSLKKLFELMGQRELRAVVLVDEFDVLLQHPNFNTAEFFGALRSLSVQTDGLALLTASRLSVAEMNRRSQEINPLGSPFFNNLIEVYLLPLQPAEVDLLLDQSLERSNVVFSTKDRASIQRLSGGHPFLVQIVAAALFEVHTQTSGTVNHAVVERRVLGWAAAHFDDTWHRLAPPARRALVRVALAEQPEPPALIAFEPLAPFDPDMRRLVDTCMLRPDPDGKGLLWQGERWRVSAAAFSQWLIEQRKWDDLQPARPKALSAAERDHLRNVLEQKQRRMYVLEEQLARQGRANAQPQIIIDIKDLKREIAEIERRLEEAGG